jgi:hypothetical protein
MWRSEHYFQQRSFVFHVKWGPCHHGMARLQIADGGNGLQIWRVAANILSKQWRTADKGWHSSLEVRRGANNSSSLKISLLQNVTKGLGLGRNIWRLNSGNACYHWDQNLLSSRLLMDRTHSTHGKNRGMHIGFWWECQKETTGPLGRPTRREDNIKMYLIEICLGGMDWINLAQYSDQWRALVDTVMNFRVP